MVLRHGLIGATLVLLALPARAEEAGMVLWDQHLALSMNEALISDDPCHAGPYRRYRQTCVGNELNISLDREFRQETLLDEIALMVHRYRYLNLNREITPGTSFRFKAQLSNLYRQEAEVRLTFRVLF